MKIRNLAEKMEGMLSKRKSGGDRPSLWINMKGGKTKTRIRIISPDFYSFKRHWFQTAKRGFRHIEPCPFCEFREKMFRIISKKYDKETAIEINKKLRGFYPSDRFCWTVIQREESQDNFGNVMGKIFEHGWEIFEELNNIMSKGSFNDPEKGYDLMYRLKMTRKDGDVIKNYSIERYTKEDKEGDIITPRSPLTDEEKSIEVIDYAKVYKPADEDETNVIIEGARKYVKKLLR